MDLSVGSVHTTSASPAIVQDYASAKGREDLVHAALCLVVDRRGRVLAVSRPVSEGGEMSIPGGHVEPNETPMQAAVRELKEETGIEAKDLALVSELKSPDGRPVHVFRAGSFSGKASALEPDTKVGWLRPLALMRQAKRFGDSLKTLSDAGAMSATFAPSKPGAPSPEKAAKKAPAGHGKGTIHVRADLAPGGALHVRHNMNEKISYSADGAQSVTVLRSGEFALRDVRQIVVDANEVDPASVGVKLKGKPCWKDGTPKKLVWVQLAEVGAWKGHPSGEFEMTPVTFAQIKANFERRGIPIQYDMEHASEQDATEGSIPVTGAPAQGWVHRIDNRGIGGLWGLTEWRDYAREGILDGAFAFLSPAIRFDSKDTITGVKVGARLTSVAITNQPFLSGLDGLRAAKDTAALTSESAFDLSMAHHPNEYMPAIRACLGMHEMAGAAECKDRLNVLRGHYQADRDGDKDGFNEGVDIKRHLLPLRDFLGDSSIGMTWDDVLDKIDEHLDAAGDPSLMSDKTPAAVEQSSTPATEPETNTMDPKLLKDAQDEAKTLKDKSAALEADVKTLTDKGIALEAEVVQLRETVAKGSESVKNAETANADLLEIITAVSTVALKDELPKAVVLRLVADNVKLLDEKIKRNEADLVRDVEETIATYADKKGLSLSDKPALLDFARSSRESFNKMYPPIPAEQRHLLRTIVPAEKRPEVEKPILSASELTAKLMSDHGQSYADACSNASLILVGKMTMPAKASA
jgi:ADP-ribose pyrophosphatase YjhB (NUDIX family)